MTGVKNKIKSHLQKFIYSNKEKFICIGKNKTGTTSLAKIFKDRGYKLGSQKIAEQLVFNWADDDFNPIVDFVKYKGEMFQDVPFSLPKSYQILEENIPKSKFILTIRNSPEEWYESLTKFHSKLWGQGSIPNKRDLQNAEYRYKGYAWEAFRVIHNTPEDDLYNKDILIQEYIEHNKNVIDYFSDKPNKLLVANLNEPLIEEKITDFCKFKDPLDSIPWENKTASL